MQKLFNSQQGNYIHSDYQLKKANQKFTTIPMKQALTTDVLLQNAQKHKGVDSSTNMLFNQFPQKTSIDKTKYKAIAYYEVGKVLLNYYLNNKKSSHLNPSNNINLKSINYLTLYINISISHNFRFHFN